MVTLEGRDFTYLGSFRLPITGRADSVATFAFKGTCKQQPGGMTFCPPYGTNGAQGSLFISGTDTTIGANNGSKDQMCMEVGIPTDAALSKSSTLANLPTGTIVQDFGYVTRHANGIAFMGSSAQGGGSGGNGCFLGGVVRYQHPTLGLKLMCNFATTYPGTGDINCFCWSSTTLSNAAAGTALGALAPVYSTPNDAAWGLNTSQDIGSFIAAIPPKWQASFGGNTHFSGLAGPSIISRESAGPAMWAYKLADIGVTNPAPATGYMYYTDPSHVCPLWTQSDFTYGTGGAFLRDDGARRGLVYLGEKCHGVSWYGFGSFYYWWKDASSTVASFTPPAAGQTWNTPVTSFQATTDLPPLKPGFTQPAGFQSIQSSPPNCTAVMSGGTGVPPAEDTTYYEVDADDFASKGTHTGDGYKACLWIYDPQDVVTNFNAAGNPWALTPQEYDIDQMAGGNPWLQMGVHQSESSVCQAIAYDPDRSRVFISQLGQDTVGDANGSYPLIHVYAITQSGGTPAPSRVVSPW